MEVTLTDGTLHNKHSASVPDLLLRANKMPTVTTPAASEAVFPLRLKAPIHCLTQSCDPISR